MKRLSLLFLAVMAVCANADVFQIDDIRINGLQRVSAGTVFAALPVQVGDLVDEEAIRSATRSLFRTGYFDNIRMARDGDALLIVLRERPAVSEINLEGNRAIKSEQLLDALRENGLAEGQIFRQSILEGMSLELERQYVAQGRYGALVKTSVEQLPQNRVGVNIDIDEGDVAAIKHINIVGNRDFRESDLRDLFELTTTNWLSWIRGDDKYAKEKLSGDLERLESWYLDRGYLNFNVNSTQVAISPNKERVYITVNITEGDVFTVSEVELAGDPILPEEDILRLVLLREGQTFSQNLMTTTSEFITQRLGNEGYSFTEVEGFPELDEENRTAKITFFINPGKRAYVRRIEFRGNTKTMDEVLRREMRQMEGAAASTGLIEHSKVRLERLGFFKEVQVETTPVPGTSDQLDVIYTVEEQPSGSVGASLGFAQDFGLVIGANLQENNFLGTGKGVGVGLNRSEFRTNVAINYTEPYFTNDGVSAGFSLFGRTSDFDEINLSSFSSDSFGATTNFSYPVSEIQRIGFGFGYENLSLDEGSFPSEEIVDFIDENGDKYNIFTFNLSWIRSTLNRGVFATRGSSNRFALELSAPLSDLEYYKLTYSGQYFQPLFRGLTLRLRTELGFGDSYGDTTRLPFLKNFYAGGFGSVRGFERNTLGPRDTPFVDENGNVFDDPDPFGGNVLIEGSAEILFPLPFIKDQRTLQSAFFIDIGNVFDTDCGTKSVDLCSEPDLAELRYSAGFGVTWLSGFGPLTFSIAKPLNAGPEDEEEAFQFSIGQTF